MQSIVTRFPPSPSGYLHLGGARTALFNWLYARHTKGRFVLRFEDTDVARSTQASIDAIYEALEWLGIDWDEGPYFQSQRADLHNEHIDRLIAGDQAYHCTCSPEQIDAMRTKAMAAGDKPRYDGTCRAKGLGPQPGAVVRFKAPATGITILDDTIKGRIVFQNAELDDFIIRRSDGTPTYNLAVVVDDITMGINTVIRGDDHVNNTPKQILLFQALDAPLPTFGHVPMVLGADRSRLSKRHGATSVTAYRDMGYLPDAMINFLVRLGWSHGDQEFFTREELIEKFSLENIGRSAGIFNPEKLQAINADHIKATPPAHLISHLQPFLKTQGVETHDETLLCKIIPTLNTRSKTLADMAEGAHFYFRETIEFDEKAAKKFLRPVSLEPMRLLTEKLTQLKEFTEAGLEDVFKQVMDQTEIKLGKIAQPVRVALTGGTVSPGIFEIIAVLGRETTLRRLQKAVAYIQKRADAG